MTSTGSLAVLYRLSRAVGAVGGNRLLGGACLFSIENKSMEVCVFGGWLHLCRETKFSRFVTYSLVAHYGNESRCKNKL
mgnify:CR=1 FL=1